MLRLVLGLALALFLPGLALLALLQPHKPVTVFAWAERIFLSIVLSIALLVGVSIPLAYGPWQLGGRGLFQGSATGAPVLEALLGGMTLAFAAGARWRARRAPPFPTPELEETALHRAAEAVERGEADPTRLAARLYGAPPKP